MFAKIFDQIFDSTLADDYITRHVFMDLLVLADKEGFVDITLAAVARRTNIPIDILEGCIAKLSEPDTHSRTKEHEGRRIILIDETREWGWQIVNFEKYHKMRNEDAKREYNRAYMKKKREADKGSSTIVVDSSNSSTAVAEVAHVNVDVDVDKDIDKKEEKEKSVAELADNFGKYTKCTQNYNHVFKAINAKLLQGFTIESIDEVIKKHEQSGLDCWNILKDCKKRRECIDLEAK